MLIMKPNRASSVTVSRGTGAANLLTPDPKEVWTDSTVNSDATLDFDFGAVVAWDTVFVGFTNAAATAEWGISGGSTGYGDTTYLPRTTFRASSDAIGPRYHGFFTRSPTTSDRYMRITLKQFTGNPNLQVGIVAIGASFKPTYNREWGAGRSLIDTGTKQRLRGGGFAIGRGAKVPGYQWVLGDLTEADVQALWALAVDRGETDPIVVVEDPDATAGRSERLHYGLFNRLEAYERQDPDLNRWALSMEGWN